MVGCATVVSTKKEDWRRGSCVDRCRRNSEACNSGMSRVDSEEGSPKRKKRCFGVWVEVGYYKYNQPAIYKGFSKDAGPPVVGPNDTDRIVFGTGVRIHCFDEPSPDGLTTEREENVSKEEDLILKKSEWSDFGLKNKKSRVEGWTNPPKKKTWYEFLGQAQAVSD